MTAETKPHYYGPERQLPEASRVDFKVLKNWVGVLEKNIQIYRGATKQEHDSLVGILQAYEIYLKERYKDFLWQTNPEDSEKLNEFFKAKVSQDYIDVGLEEKIPSGVSPQEFRNLVMRALQDKAGAAEDHQQLCEVFGIEYTKTNEIYGPTEPKPIPRGGSGPSGEHLRHKDKLRELVAFLIQNEFFGEQIKVFEGSVGEGQMRGTPYIIVEIPIVDKQILICDRLGEGAFVSGTILNHQTYVKLNKENWVSEQGLEPVDWDEEGRWLLRIKALLLEGTKTEEQGAEPEANQTPKGTLELRASNFERAKTEVLGIFPTSRDYLRFLETTNNIVNEQRFFNRLKKCVFNQTSYNRVNTAEAIECALKIYGENDPNLIHAKMLEKRDKAYLQKVFTQGLPKGVNYFLPEEALGKPGRPFEAGLSDKEFMMRYMQGSMDVQSRRMFAELNITFIDFLAAFRPDIHKKIIDANAQGKKTGKLGSSAVKEADLNAACAELYPESRQFKFFKDLESSQELGKIIRGGEEYNTDGLYGLIVRVGKRDKDNTLKAFELVKAPPFGTFETLNDSVLARKKYSVLDVGKFTSERFGIGSQHFIKVMGVIQKNKKRASLEEFLEALKIVYPNKEQGSEQLQYLIDRRHAEQMKLMIKGQYPDLDKRYIWSFLSRKKRDEGEKILLEAVPCPNFAAFKQVIFGGSDQPGKTEINERMRKNYGFGATAFSTAVGAKEKKQKGDLSLFFKAVQILYPESHEEIEIMNENLAQRRNGAKIMV